jgi:hypothetical protein
LADLKNCSIEEAEDIVFLELHNDFEKFSRKCLKIRTKSGAIVPFTLNRAQKYLHERLEKQLLDKGKVRALILKGRQQGCSTYVGARFYKKAIRYNGQRVFILTHERDATTNLFEMVNRYHEHCEPLLKPVTGADNASSLDFPLLDSSYRVGTAGAKAVGRSQTLQLFHASEYAYWPNAEDHAAGILQAVPDLLGTEIIKESTANGMGNMFHREWQAAEAGQSEYEAIFIPWYWQDEYRKPIPDDFSLSQEDMEYQSAYKLDNEQMAWRISKIQELGDLLFMQEYPATASEAFQLTGHDSYITPALVVKARKAQCDALGPLILGVDPARYGDDRFAVAWRKGRCVPKIESKSKIDLVSSANWIRQIIDNDKPERVFIDVGGLGAGTVDILMSWGAPYSNIIKAVNFGSEPQDNYGNDRGGPRNRRAEMWMRSKKWLEDVAGAQIPDSDSLQADACAPGYKYDMHSRLVLESKEDMGKRGVRSPDEWDAIALTFAEPVGLTKKTSSPITGRKRMINLDLSGSGSTSGRWMK